MTAKRMWVIEMPEGWKPGECHLCKVDRCGQPICGPLRCALEDMGCKPAVEIAKEDRVIASYQPGENGKWETTYRLDGKPVTLYAVEEEKI